MLSRGSALVATLFVLGCSGTVVVDGDGSGGGDGTTSTSTATTSTVTTGGPCDDHADCPGQLCQFGTGQCIQSCTFDDECPAGEYCDPCATSSCPGCLDCTRGCMPGGPPPPVPCADHADCGGNPGENVCVFAQGFCAQRCGPGSPPCPPGTACDDCATSSCPGCRDCVGACMGAQK